MDVEPDRPLQGSPLSIALALHVFVGSGQSHLSV
nr:MAG TPA: hypothetical protein [Crassvirales sp.]